MVSRILNLFTLLAMFSSCTSAEQEGDYMKLEQSVCGLKEPFIFWLWSNQAGSPNAGRLAGLRNVEDMGAWIETILWV